MTPARRDRPGRLWSLWDIMNEFRTAEVASTIWRAQVFQEVARSAMLSGRPGEAVDQSTMNEVRRFLDDVRAFATYTSFSKLLTQAEVIAPRFGADSFMNVSMMHGDIGTLSDTLIKELREHTVLMVDQSRRGDYVAPLSRFGEAATKFSGAAAAMVSASRCFALEEWDASVFHAMRVLEHGLRWLASQFRNLTLKKPIELENWENIISNIKARIDDELARSAPRTLERDADLAFYGDVAKEFRYFKDAWRNHVMHNRNDPYDQGTSSSVLDHVAIFMKSLAVRV
jgi:hypothetical protein